MVILEEDHCGCFLGAWLWAVGYSYPSVFFLFSIKWSDLPDNSFI